MSRETFNVGGWNKVTTVTSVQESGFGVAVRLAETLEYDGIIWDDMGWEMEEQETTYKTVIYQTYQALVDWCVKMDIVIAQIPYCESPAKVQEKARILSLQMPEYEELPF